MHNIQISKSLDSVIATATFNAVKRGATHAFEDILFLELITQPDSLCYQLLKSRLKPEQFQLLETQIDRITSAAHAPSSLSLAGITPEIFYRDMVSAIAVRYPEARRISTIHALHFIVSDKQTAAARILAMLGITINNLDEMIAEYSKSNALIPLLGLTATPQPTETKSTPIKDAVPHPLAKFGVELTAMAKRGEIDPVIGREDETQRVVEILSRRKKNNPILVGEAGVGKSAIIDGLAIRIAEGDVPHTIRDKRLFSIDISALVAGTKFRGEFEERMQQLLTALRTSRDTIVFIDEIHTIVGAGSTQGSLDTANILKPALARGEIQTIGATTLDEYRKNIESDSALDRRFQRVVVEPTSIAQSIEILQRIAPSYEAHHRVKYSPEAIEACVTLSNRYITDRHLPDKAIDLLDEAGAKISISSQGESSEILRSHIEQIVTQTTGIPVEKIGGDEIKRLRNLQPHLQSRVIGQDSAIERLARTIKRSRAGIADSTRPIGVFMFVGPTGVGKTLLAKELSQWMFGHNRSLIRLDMSEYGQSHTSARLFGSPPGYVGYGESGELAEAVRRNPYSVVLLDEIEKAHPDIFNVMLQIFDEGHLTDGTGRKIDFRNTIIIMTSNVGSQSVAERPKQVGYATSSKIEAAKQLPQRGYRAALEQRFAPEFLNRIDDILIFNSLEKEDIEKIVTLELERIFARTRDLGYQVRITNAARKELATLGYESKYGARALRRTLIERVEEPISDLIIEGELTAGKEVVIERIRSSRGVRLRVA
ncbi:MAG: ATP-dependent Clp protease ATP-binding subunit [Rikenellaceae bacterium]